MIEGALNNVPLSDVLQIISTGQKSGVLTLSKGYYRARIYFELGNIQYAHITPGIHLGEILVRMDLLTTYEVQEILLKQTHENAGTPLGLIAVHQGFIAQEGLHRALKAQTLEVLTELMLWKSGTFIFSERSVNASQVPVENTFDTMMLIMSVIERIDNWRKGSVRPEEVFDRQGDPTRVTLPEGAWEVLGYVNGKRSAASIAAELDLAEKQVYCILCELQDRQIINPVERFVDEPKVLILSDSNALQRLIKLAVQRTGIKPYIAEDDDAGFAFITEYRPQAIIVDDSKGNGWDFIRQLRKLSGFSYLPAILLTNEPPGGGLLGRFNRPKAFVLAKPFHELELQELITKLVGQTLA